MRNQDDWEWNTIPGWAPIRIQAWVRSLPERFLPTFWRQQRYFTSDPSLLWILSWRGTVDIPHITGSASLPYLTLACLKILKMLLEMVMPCLTASFKGKITAAGKPSGSTVKSRCKLSRLYSMARLKTDVMLAMDCCSMKIPEDIL